MNVDDAMAAVYESLAQDNKDIDLHIGNLKTAMRASGQREAVVDPERLFQNNREGRKMMQAYFKKRGVKVVFKSENG